MTRRKRRRKIERAPSLTFGDVCGTRSNCPRSRHIDAQSGSRYGQLGLGAMAVIFGAPHGAEMGADAG